VPEIHRHAERYGMPGLRADGNDVIVVFSEATRAVERARQGEGPTLLEFETYRIFEHCGINEDDDLGYRTREEVEAWKARGPLEKGKHLVSEADARRMEEEIQSRIDRAFEYARSSPWPTTLFAEGAAR
jgi:TPP-dependent pyruvate/acetoin dehydrogenase alpha subunit